MKKFDWKKVLILGFALLLCFALVACNDREEKPKDEKVSAKTFLNTLIGGVTNIIDTLGTDSDVRHIDATLVVKVGEGQNELGKDANVAIRIAGNFTAEIGKNEVLLEVKNMNEKGKILFGLYEHANKIYLQESVTSADHTVQQLALTGVAKLNMQTYLAKLPGILEDALSSIDLGAVLSGPVIDSVAGGLGNVFPDIKKTETGYSAVLNVEGLNAFLKDLDSLLGTVLVQYRDIINVILPDVLGVTIDEKGGVQKSGDTYPSININVDIDENSQFNGLTFDYAWPKKGNSGNDVKVNVGLSNIKINTTSETVTAGMASEFANYAEGALKANVELNVPGLTSAGFKVNGALYLQPGVDDVNGTVESANSAVKLKLIATAPDGTAYPLKAEYKYVDSGTASGREGRIYFDIEEVARLAGIYQEGTNYRFYEKFDVAALLVGLANPTQKAFELDGSSVLPSGYTGTAYFKLQHNWQYYQKYNWVDEVNPLWSDVSVLNEAQKEAGGKTTKKTGYDQEKDEFFIEFELTLKENDVTVVKYYRASVSQANMLAAMADGTEKVTGIKATVIELQKEADPNLKFYDANNAVSTDASIANRLSFNFSVIGEDGIELPQKYSFRAVTTGEAAVETIDATQEIGKRLTQEGGILDIIKADVTASIPKGFDFELRIVYKYSYNKYGLMTIDALKALPSQTFEELRISSGTDAGLLSIKDDHNKTYSAIISVVLKRNLAVTSGQIVTDLKNEKDKDGNYTGAYEKYLALQHYVYGEAQDGTAGAPKLPETMKYDIEVFQPTSARPEFKFDINAIGKFLQDVILPKIDGLKNGSLDITLDDAKAILGMGEYLKTPELFAAQIRMLLTNEKNSEAFQKFSVTTPYKLPKRNHVSEIDMSGQALSLGDVKTLNQKFNAKLQEELYFEILYNEFGNFTKEQLLDGGNSGWTDAQADGYLALVLAENQAPDLQKRTEYYFKTMFTTFEARRAAHSVAYETDRVKKETDAMNAIRGYIGGKGDLAAVTSVKDFLYKADGTGRITFRLKFGKDAPIISGMPISFELQVLRNDGTNDVLIASAKLGLQFIKASDIPTDAIPADYWNNATWVKEGLETVTVGGKQKQVAKAAKYLLQAHATLTGLMTTENSDGWMVLIP